VSNSLLTVVVCTHNRAHLLASTLDSLNAAHRVKEGAEILVVANHCSDETHRMLDTYTGTPGKRLPMRWLAEPTKGKSHALNLALQEVHTPLLAFVDDDQRVDAGYLEGIRDAARDTPNADLICGRLLPDWDGSEPAWVHDEGQYRIYPLPVPHFDLGPIAKWLVDGDSLPSGGNIVVRSESVARIGPFSTELGPVGHNLVGAEDSEWLLRALHRGATLRYAPEILQHHYIDAERLTLGYLVRMTYLRTASNVGIPGAQGDARAVPVWALRKLGHYAFHVLLSWRTSRRRFYLMRVAAALGEISGYRRQRGTLPEPTSANHPIKLE
jgi:glycosyltransferase involved in cell wall biosynthesis